MPKNHFLNPFWGTSKNWWLELKVCADPSWLPVFKNGLKKCSSLKDDWVIDVWSWCKNMTEGGEGAGPAWVWGSVTVKMPLFLLIYIKTRKLLSQ